MSRQEWLEKVPEEIHDQTCRCPGPLTKYEFSKERNMMLCSLCKKPQGYVPSQWRSSIVKYCDICEKYWVRWEQDRWNNPNSLEDEICPDCDRQVSGG